jgi:hypothetical protein
VRVLCLSLAATFDVLEFVKTEEDADD